MTLGYSWVLGWHGGRERLEWSDEPTGVKTDFECLLHLELLIGVCVAGIGGGTLEIAHSEESLDKFIRLSGLSSFTKCSKGGLDTRHIWELRYKVRGCCHEGCIESKCPTSPRREQPELAFIITEVKLKNGPINLAWLGEHLLFNVNWSWMESEAGM
jgi:hypothetical protein